MFELTRRLEFSAAHYLRSPALTDDENRALYGPCYGLHGHNYVMDVTVKGPVDPITGMVMDLNVMAKILDKTIFAVVDHKHLDADVPWLEGVISTAENVAAAMWEQLAPQLEGLLFRIRLFESAANVVDYHGPQQAG
ncbi:MAG: 6-pyruvoyltetrahydropterin/6-carboxytetrahydropterin synthase [Pseudohongiellaceae bacterium]|jgi:6-pyruvoyltetrahydropterin/6-carboxytetrahydropterin synthase